MYKVMIVDDQSSSQNLMKYAIMRGGDRYILHNTLQDADLVLPILKDEKVDLLLLDIYTGAKAKENGIEIAKKVKALYPDIKIIMLTFVLQRRHIEKAREIGCEGFWYKDHADIDLLNVMDSVMAGNTYYPDDLPVVTIGTAKSTDFSEKELAILQAKVNGHSNERVCKDLDIKRRTLDTHLSNIKNKTGYDNLLKLVADVAANKFIIIDEKDSLS